MNRLLVLFLLVASCGMGATEGSYITLKDTPGRNILNFVPAAKLATVRALDYDIGLALQIALASGETTVEIPSGNYAVSPTISTLPGTFTIIMHPGAVLTTTGGICAINAKILAGDFPIFSSTSNVELKGVNGVVKAVWFGMKPTATGTVNKAAIENAMRACYNTTTGESFGIVQLPPGDFQVDTGINVTVSGVTFQGVSNSIYWGNAPGSSSDNRTRLFCATAGTLFTSWGTEQGWAAASVAQSLVREGDHTVFKDISFYSNTGTSGSLADTALSFKGTKAVKNCTFIAFKGSAVKFVDWCIGSIVENCRFAVNGVILSEAALSVSGYFTTTFRISDCVSAEDYLGILIGGGLDFSVNNCIIENSKTYGILVWASVAGQIIANGEFSNLYMEGNGTTSVPSSGTFFESVHLRGSDGGYVANTTFNKSRLAASGEGAAYSNRSICVGDRVYDTIFDSCRFSPNLATTTIFVSALSSNTLFLDCDSYNSPWADLQKEGPRNYFYGGATKGKGFQNGVVMNNSMEVSTIGGQGNTFDIPNASTSRIVFSYIAGAAVNNAPSGLLVVSPYGSATALLSFSLGVTEGISEISDPSSLIVATETVTVGKIAVFFSDSYTLNIRNDTGVTKKLNVGIIGCNVAKVTGPF